MDPKKDEELSQLLMTPRVKALVLDIETSPLEVRVWRLGKQYIGPHQILKESAMLTWSAKWLCSPDIMGQKVGNRQAGRREDHSILPKLWELMDMADIIIGHNLDNFDIKYINSRFIYHGMAPPAPYQTIDTLKAARRSLGEPSNSLKYLNNKFELEGKIKTNFELWGRCLEGDKAALQEMLEYNQRDVSITEDLYFYLRPYIKGHPNMGLYVESTSTVCPSCGGVDITWGRHYYTPAGRFRAFRCNRCFSIGRARFSDYPGDKAGVLARSVAR